MVLDDMQAMVLDTARDWTRDRTPVSAFRALRDRGEDVPRLAAFFVDKFRKAYELPPLAFAWSGMAAVMPDYLPRLVDLAPGLVAGFACNGRGIAMTTAMGRELALWAGGAALSDIAIPAARPKAIPYHGLARLAPNALLPVSMVRDAFDLRQRRV